MSKIIDIHENMAHKISEVICINCKHRFISVRPTQTKLQDLECSNCKKQGFIIETGEEIFE